MNHSPFHVANPPPPQYVSEEKRTPQKEKPFDAQVKRVGDYLLGLTLGTGSYGKVKEAISINEKTTKYAVKVISKRNLKKIPDGEITVLREVEILRMLHHENCIKLHNFFVKEEQEKIYIVMEYLGGGSLLDLVEKCPNNQLPLCQVRYLFSQLLNALEYIHNIGIIHRDVKPNNMLLTSNGILKLSDFGVAYLLGSEDPPKGNGSPAIQPPEIASGKDIFSGTKIDVWAAGTTLYYMAVGTFPFKAQNVYNLFQSIEKGDYTIPDLLEPTLKDFISTLMCVEYTQRPTISEAKNHPWMKLPLEDARFVLPNLPQSAFVENSGAGCKCGIL